MGVSGRQVVALSWSASLGLATAGLMGCGEDIGPDAGEHAEGASESGGETKPPRHTGEPSIACTDQGAAGLYQRRIAPLLEADRPSSCNRCHLSGVDLAAYIQGDACSTMVCMHAKGLVDFDAPEDSVVLDWISRGAPDSPLITREIIQEEHAAMLAWIGYYADCGTELCEVGENPCGDDPTHHDCVLPDQAPDDPMPFEDPGGCEEKTLEAMFSAKVYAWRGRCGPCHFANSDTSLDGPHWIDVGSCDLGSLQTMRNVVNGGYLNPDNPAQSLLLLKPLAEEQGGVRHGGHDKINSFEDPGYTDMLAWIERWADCQG